jgi:branched-chain amino acid transport system permease protein
MLITVLQAILQGLMMGTIYASLGIGLNVVFACTHILNFAHGSFVLIGMYFCLVLFRFFGLDPYISMFISSAILFGIGVFLFRYIISKSLDAEVIAAVQVTVGLIILIESVLHIIFTAEIQTVPAFAQLDYIDAWLFRIRMPLVIGFLICGFQIASFHWVLYHTGFGRSIRAIVDDRKASSLLGINVSKVQTFVFGLGILTAGFTGAAFVPLFTFDPNSGLELCLFAFMVVIIGGMGNFIGTLVAGLLIGVVSNLGLVLLGGFMGPALLYGVFVFLLVVKPMGLLGLRI